MVRHQRQGHRLDKWITSVRADPLPALHSFASGLERDHAAVLAGLTLPDSSGAIEGQVCKIKYLKRQMYGHATSTYSGNGTPQLTSRNATAPQRLIQSRIT